MYTKNVVKLMFIIVGVISTGLNIWMIYDAVSIVGKDNPILYIFAFIQIMIIWSLCTGWNGVKKGLKNE